MLSDVEFRNMMNEIKHSFDNLEYNLNTITLGKVLNRMGFPENWYNITNITKKV